MRNQSVPNMLHCFPSFVPNVLYLFVFVVCFSELFCMSIMKSKSMSTWCLEEKDKKLNILLLCLMFSFNPTDNCSLCVSDALISSPLFVLSGSECKHRRAGCYQSHQTGTG